MSAISRITTSVPGRIAVIGGVVLALGGGSATAATFITSKQIKDGTITVKDLSKSTVKQLQGGSGKNGGSGSNGSNGSQGPAGPAGPQGAAGAQGAAGPQGPAGANGAPGAAGPQGASAFSALPSGTTIGGSIMIDDHGVSANDLIDAATSFGTKLPALPTAKISGFSQFVNNVDEAADGQCPGTLAAPASAPGVLCVYISNPLNVKVDSVLVTPSAHRYGFVLRAGATADGDTQIEGVWTYKAA